MDSFFLATDSSGARRDGHELVCAIAEVLLLEPTVYVGEGTHGAYLSLIHI